MKVFISSVMAGYQDYRNAAASAARALDCTLLQAEDFGALPQTPQQACLAAAREADVTLVLLGERYGVPQASGLSATHEEFQEARSNSQLLVFVQEGVTREPTQAEFVREAQEWASGAYTTSFRTPEELRDAVTRDLHRLIVSQMGSPMDAAVMAARGRSRIQPRGGYSGTWLHFIAVGGPQREVLPPARASDRTLHESLEQLALFGQTAIFDRAGGSRTTRRGTELVVEQNDASATLTSDGIVHVRRPAPRSVGTLPALIEEDITTGLAACVAFAAEALDIVDPVQRLSHVVAITALEGSTLGWRTAAEHLASPSSMAMHLRPGGDGPVMVPGEPLLRPRAELKAGRGALVADHIARLAQAVRGE